MTELDKSQKYLRREQAAEYIGVSLRTLDQLKHDGDIPFYQLSRRLIVYGREDLDVFMESHRVAMGRDASER